MTFKSPSQPNLFYDSSVEPQISVRDGDCDVLYSFAIAVLLSRFSSSLGAHAEGSVGLSKIVKWPDEAPWAAWFTLWRWIADGLAGLCVVIFFIS